MNKCKFCGSYPVIDSVLIGNREYKAIAKCSNYKCCARTKEFFLKDAEWQAIMAWNQGKYDIHRDDEGFIQRI